MQAVSWAKSCQMLRPNGLFSRGQITPAMEARWLEVRWSPAPDLARLRRGAEQSRCCLFGAKSSVACWSIWGILKFLWYPKMDGLEWFRWYSIGCFGGTPISGNHHILDIMYGYLAHHKSSRKCPSKYRSGIHIYGETKDGFLKPEMDGDTTEQWNIVELKSWRWWVLWF